LNGELFGVLLVVFIDMYALSGNILTCGRSAERALVPFIAPEKKFNFQKNNLPFS
jgi:hypothetical protein